MSSDVKELDIRGVEITELIFGVRSQEALSSEQASEVELALLQRYIKLDRDKSKFFNNSYVSSYCNF